jgi:hypothetical protein
MRASLFLVGLTTLCTSCNAYDLFSLSGYQQDTFSNRADVLFVIDNSTSMVEESVDLALNFGGFIEDLSARESNTGRNGVGDAVASYISYVDDRAAFVDYQFAITTTDVDKEAGAYSVTVQRGDSDVAETFTNGLLCDATCFTNPQSLGNDPSYLCGEPLSEQEEVTTQYLGCVCGSVEAWLDNCGSAKEEALEAVFLAMCRAVENPPEECFDGFEIDGEVFEPAFTEDDVLSNEGLLRDNSTFLPVIVTDEGDDSRREAGQEKIPEAYLELFSRFRQRMAWVVIGPALNEDLSTACPGPATSWGSFRYEYLVYDSNGLKIDITDGECENTEFRAALDSLGDLLQNLSTTFPLSSVPIKETLQVAIDDKPVERATEEGLDRLGLPVYSDGWTYRADENAVVFHGNAIPSPNADVRVYYLPLDGMPRELPF